MIEAALIYVSKHLLGLYLYIHASCILAYIYVRLWANILWDRLQDSLMVTEYYKDLVWKCAGIIPWHCDVTFSQLVSNEATRYFGLVWVQLCNTIWEQSPISSSVHNGYVLALFWDMNCTVPMGTFLGIWVPCLCLGPLFRSARTSWNTFVRGRQKSGSTVCINVCFTDANNHTYSESSWQVLSTDAPWWQWQIHTQRQRQRQWQRWND